jgi:DNA repair protein RadC
MQNALTLKNNQELLSSIVGPRAATSLAEKYPTLTEITRADNADLTALPGVGHARAAQIKAALELAARLSHEVLGDTPTLDTPEKVADYLREDVRPYTTETLHVLLLNTRRKLIRVCQVANGTLDTIMVHSREVFKVAIAANASAIILCHNHPGSGDPTPSDADIKVTRDLVRAGQLLKIEVLERIK